MCDLASVHVVIYGHVQGVYFRDFVSRQAIELGLIGYVRNLPGSIVEVQADGERKQLAELIGYLNVGPPAAKVARVMTRWSEYTGAYSRFSVMY